MAAYDDIVESYVSRVKEKEPGSVAVVTMKGYEYDKPESEAPVRNMRELFRHMEIYLSDYDVYQLQGSSDEFATSRPEDDLFFFTDDDVVPIRPETEEIVIIAEGVGTEDRTSGIMAEERLEGGQILYVIDVTERDEAPFHRFVFRKTP